MDRVHLATDTGQGPLHWLLLLAGPTAAAVLLAAARGLRRRGSRRGAWAGRSASLLAGAVACHTVGVLFMLRLENAYHTCNEERFGFPDGSGIPPLVENEDSLFPVGSVCTWADGHTVDLVPWFVNPATGLLLAGAAVCAALALARTGRPGPCVGADGTDGAVG
ncbi:hypothetical protein GCM10010420_03840 [Streptomyces glaucosporus]|uniref:Integral membrane protein n=1 Tax=Streptomyces glaucosporus TaxID=284044 RepID=A0ABN3HQ57_9ACTN